MPLKMAVQVIDKDLGLSKFMRECQKLAKKPQVKVGIMGSQATAPKKGHKGVAKINLVTVAAIHEFGSPAAHIPRRSFLNDTMAEHGAEFTVKAAELVEAIMQDPDMTTEKALGLLGELVQSKVQARFHNNNWPPLADSTEGQRKKGKGNSKFKGHNPLIDTGQLLRSIRYLAVMEPESE